MEQVCLSLVLCLNCKAVISNLLFTLSGSGFRQQAAHKEFLVEPGLPLAFRSLWVILLPQVRDMLLMLTQRKGKAMPGKCLSSLSFLLVLCLNYQLLEALVCEKLYIPWGEAFRPDWQVGSPVSDLDLLVVLQDLSCNYYLCFWNNTLAMVCFSVIFFTIKQLQGSNLKEIRLFEKF